MGKLVSVRDSSDVEKPKPKQRQVPTRTFAKFKKCLHYVCKHQWKDEMMLLISQEGIHGEGGVLATCYTIYLTKAYSKMDVV